MMNWPNVDGLASYFNCNMDTKIYWCNIGSSLRLLSSFPYFFAFLSFSPHVPSFFPHSSFFFFYTFSLLFAFLYFLIFSLICFLPFPSFSLLPSVFPYFHPFSPNFQFFIYYLYSMFPFVPLFTVSIISPTLFLIIFPISP